MFACTFVITGTSTWAMYGLYMYFFTLNFREQVQSQPKSAPDQAQKNQEVQFYMRCKSFWEYWERERELKIRIIYILTSFSPSKVKSRESWKSHDKGGTGKAFGIQTTFIQDWESSGHVTNGNIQQWQFQSRQVCILNMYDW